MTNEVLTPPEPHTSKPAPEVLHTLPQAGHVSVDHLGIGGGLQEEGIFSSLVENVRDLFFPTKLPPLVLTSQPIAVPDRMKVKRSPASTATAIVIHALLILLIGFLLAKKILKIAEPAKVTAVDISTPPIAPMALKAMGGGGGNHDITPATKGLPPPPVKVPLVPLMKPIIDKPKIEAPPSLVMQPIKMPTSALNIGVLNGPKVAGPVSYGNGGGNGLGPGHGDGLGPGNGGNTGGGYYNVGGGVSAPIPIFTPEAEFSEEARRAKYQGDVNVAIVIGADGLVKSAHVIRDPGMGLADKALEAVRQWRFKPAMKDGKPVPVGITGEVSFTIY